MPYLESRHAQAIVVLALFGLASFSFMSIVIRRLHDLGKSGWWYIPYVFMPNAVIGFAKTNPDINIPTAVLVVVAIVAIWAFLELGFIRGTKELNKTDYGPPLVKA